MWKNILIYGSLIAVSGFFLEWLDLRTTALFYPREALLLAIAIIFTGAGLWLGLNLAPGTGKRRFQKNTVALASLGVTAREYEVLVKIAKGETTKEIARSLGVSPNTVKTHTARLFEKLSVSRRVQLIQAARALRLIP